MKQTFISTSILIVKISKYFDLWWQVVHNYGHGGYGITAAPGTSKHAVKLMQQLHLSTYGHSKL